MEKWCDIPNWEDRYQVSNLGRICSKRYNRLLKQGFDSRQRYLRVCFSCGVGTQKV